VVVDYSFFVGGLFKCFEYFCLPPCSATCLRTFKNMRKQHGAVEVRIEDARLKQQQEGLSEQEFFEKYGFVLIKQPTKMTAEDWLASSSLMLKEKPKETAPSPAQNIYSKELEPLIRKLIPDSGDIHFPNFALRRGPGGNFTYYGLGVHQDFGLYPEDMKTTYSSAEDSFEAWQKRLNDPGTLGYSMINFWRPVLPMEGPVKRIPLAMCDPNTVSVEDIVEQEIHGFVKGGQYSMGLKLNPKHKWYYYPDMTKDEVLVFRQFHYDRRVKAPYSQIRTVFHSAFVHPKASFLDEKRCSSEYRVGVWLQG